ncbi:MAG: alkaline phosphatase family protein [Acidobacteriia bacterium]|nr:alkaline phosphatase family protein [Terriglobia bacterium]
MKSSADIRSAAKRLCASLSIAVIALGPVPLRADDHQAPPAATATPIQHVVIIFQENVSFDHYFATYPNAANDAAGEPPFTPASGTPSVNGLSGPLLTDNPNAQPPFRLTRTQAVTCDQDHGYTDEQRAFNNGLMNLFVESVGVGAPGCADFGHGKGLVMGYYDGNTTTAIWNYAQHFAMSDNSYGTTFGPSTPGALNLVSGQTHGATLTQGNANNNVAAGSVIGDPRPSLALDDCTIRTAAQITMTGTNVGDLLNAKGIAWGWFQGGFQPSGHNPDGTALCATAHANVAGASTADYIPHHAPFQYYPQTANPHHLPPVSVAAIGHTDQANHQYDIAAFFAALNAGNLPAVSYLKAPAFEDGHAGYSDPLDEQTFLVNTINAIMRSPFWKSTAIFISYDDSDGWYDHQMGPIMTQSTTSADFLSGAGACGNGGAFPFQGRCGYGPRLPLLAISPFAKSNFVDHGVSDQSSILRFIEDNWNLGRIGNSSTDAIAGSLMSMFDFGREGGDNSRTLILDPATGTPVHGH